MGKYSLFYNQKGAIDLASIMTGVIVTGLIGGVISATVFAVIPWSQDHAAKSQLQQIVAAQSAYRGMSGEPSLPAGYPAKSYADSSHLAGTGLLAEGDNYCTVRINDTGYIGVAVSKTTRIYSVTDENTAPKAITEAEVPEGCSLPVLVKSPDPNPSPTLPTPTPTPTTPSPTPTPSPSQPVDEFPKLTQLTYRCDARTNVRVPITNGQGTATWSDGTTATYSGQNTSISKTLNAGVTYIVKFEGTFTRLGNGYIMPGAACLRSLDHWGTQTGVKDASYGFYGSTNLTDVPATIPSTITNMSAMFMEAYSFNDPDIGEWDVSNVTDMSYMFQTTNLFNAPLNNWNVSKVIYMDYMFHESVEFNQPLDKWNVSKVRTMYKMFYLNQAYSHPLNSWNTAALTDGADFTDGPLPDEYFPAGATRATGY